MKSFLTITFIASLLCFCLSQETSCLFNPYCDITDDLCHSDLSQFQQCIASKCNSSIIQNENQQQMFECYYIHCKPAYQPIQNDILNMIQCLKNTGDGSEDFIEFEEDGEINLDEVNQYFNKTEQGKCLAKMIIDCKLSSKECVSNFYIQLFCITSKCQLKDDASISQINQCVQDQCQSDFGELSKLNKELDQCMQKLEQTNFSNLLGTTILLVLSFFLF